MKRRALAIVIFLLLGAIVNVAVAWGFAAVWVNNTHWNHGGWAVTSWGEVKWMVFRHRRLGCLSIKSHLLLSEDKSPTTPHPQRLVESWSLIPTPEELRGSPRLDWEERAYGWPFLVVWYRTTQTDPLHALVLPRNQAVLPRDRLENGLIVDWGKLPTQYVLPLRPIWPGFAINTIFYAAVLWGLFALGGAPFALRRRLRIKRGLCPKCAYPVGANEVCTECGNTLTVRKVLPHAPQASLAGSERTT